MRATGIREVRLPSGGLVGLDGGAVGAELECFLARVLERRAHIGRDEVAVLDPLEAMPLKYLCVLSVQESACDSASPEVDVPLSFFGHGALDRHVRDLNASARNQHPKDPREDGVLVRD